MPWQDWIYVVPELHPLTHRGEEVERQVLEELGLTLETRLRGRIDHGVDLRSGTRAQAVRVAAEGNRLVIDEGDDHGIVAGGDQPTLESLFSTSKAAPTALEDGRVAFRVLDEAELFGAENANDELVDRVAEEVVREQLVDAVERAARKVALEHPGDRNR